MTREQRKIWWVAGIALVLAMPFTFMMINKGAPIGWGWWDGVNRDSGVAIDGYDPVAFHTLGEAVVGDESLSLDWNGATWHFSNAAHRELFAQEPDRYAPEFGGYCATAVSAGLTFDTDPQAWHIEDGELLLFFSSDARDDFLRQIGNGILERAHRNWGER